MRRTAVAVVLCCAVLATPVAAQGVVPMQNLSFGSFVAGGGGTVSVSAVGARSAGGGVFLVASRPGASAQFLVSGTAGAGYSITLPANGRVTLAGPGGATMAVNGFASSPSVTGQVGGGGSQLLNVGATLSVGAGQAAGPYSGIFTVTVNYN